MSDEIKISKKNLWKYSTFLLIAVVVVAAFFIFRGTGNGGTNNGNGTTQTDLSPFISNPSLFPSLGPNSAKNVVIEFSDFQCPFCGLASGLPSWVSQYQSQYGDLIGSSQKLQDMGEKNSIKFIYVPMSFLGQGSVYAAQAGYCANEQGKFWEIHDLMFENQVTPAKEGIQFTKAQLEGLANGISGINASKFKDCLETDKTLSAVQAAASQAQTAATGTPTFYVNGQKVSASWAKLSAALGI